MTDHPVSVQNLSRFAAAVAVVASSALAASVLGATAASAQLGDEHRDRPEPTLIDRTRSGGVTCRGLPAVLVGPGETHHGTDGDDVIFVSGADGRVYGNGGDDLICASAPGESGSRIHGGPGDDIILTLDGSHLVFGDGDDDVLLLNGGFNEGWGGAGDDVINGGGSTQILAYGEDGNDIINGSPGPDWLGGYAGNDLILGWGGDDLIFGMAGNDDLRGGDGFDTIGAAGGIDRCIDFAGPVHGADLSDCEQVILGLGGGIGGIKS